MDGRVLAAGSQCRRAIHTRHSLPASAAVCSGVVILILMSLVWVVGYFTWRGVLVCWLASLPFVPHLLLVRYCICGSTRRGRAWRWPSVLSVDVTLALFPPPLRWRASP